jgi:hypothetical protein
MRGAASLIKIGALFLAAVTAPQFPTSRAHMRKTTVLEISDALVVPFMVVLGSRNPMPHIIIPSPIILFTMRNRILFQ